MRRMAFVVAWFMCSGAALGGDLGAYGAMEGFGRAMSDMAQMQMEAELQRQRDERQMAAEAELQRRRHEYEIEMMRLRREMEAGRSAPPREDAGAVAPAVAVDQKKLRVERYLDRTVPGWRAVDTSEGFFSYLGEPVDGGERRLDAFRRAYEENAVGGLAQFYRDYMERVAGR